MRPPVRLRPVTPIGILTGTLRSLSDQVDDPRWISRLTDAYVLAEGLEGYVALNTTPASPALRQLAARTQAHDWSALNTQAQDESAQDGPHGLEAEMLSGHVEGQLLRFLVQITRSTRVLDIGMFSGYSALAMAEGLPEHGVVVACEIDPEVARFAEGCFLASPSVHKISVRVAPAADTLRELARTSPPFDLIFLDADKSGYAGYLDQILGDVPGQPGLLADGGLICADNTLLQGEPYLPRDPSPNGAHIAAFNHKVTTDPRLEQVLLPVRDGLTLIRRV